MYKKAKFLIFCTIFVASAAFCQKSKPGMLLFYTKNNPHLTKAGHFLGVIKPAKAAINFYTGVNTINFYLPVSVISKNYYTNNFGFFCKKEWQFEKATKIPFRFRLGSLQYNDYLEQKPNAVRQ